MRYEPDQFRSLRAWPGPRDPLDEVAAVAIARREPLLRAHGFRLRREDLEDCYSQATLELMLRVRRGGTFAGRGHLANALEQRFLSRIRDRRRALAGRSPMQAALEDASALGVGAGYIDVADRAAELERLVLLRAELRRIERLARALSEDQRLVLAAQLAQIPRASFVARYGWSTEKYRKVAQRARARLRRLIAEDAGDVPVARSRSDQDDERSMHPSPPPSGPLATAAGADPARRTPDSRRCDCGRAAEASQLHRPAARMRPGEEET